MLKFDALIIGWGKGGKSLAGALAASGRKVALVERSAQMYGGTCINIGCVPTKDLITSAEQRRATDDPTTYFEKSVADRDRLIAKLRAANHAMLEGKVAIFDGEARFMGPHEVQVVAGEETLELHAPLIVIGTGTIPATPPIPGIDLPGVYNSTTIQHADPFPQRLTIIGAGFIGLEFASMFANFGAEVTVIDQQQIFLGRTDRDVAASVHTSLTAQGVTIDLGVNVQEIRAEEGGLVVATDDAQYRSDAVLVALGRRAETSELGVEAAGIATDSRGFIKVNDHLETNVEGVYAVGDVNGGPQFTYISFDDFRILKDHLLGSGQRSRDDRRAVPWTTFLDPPLAMVGMSEAEVRASGRPALVACAQIASIAVMPRPKIVGKPEGMMKFFVDKETDAILGAALHCIDSQELINMVAAVMRLGGTATDLRDGIWTHPSSTEGFNGVLGMLHPLAD